MPWMASCGAMRRSSMLNRVDDFGQWADSANRPPIAVSSLYSADGVPDQSWASKAAA